MPRSVNLSKDSIEIFRLTPATINKPCWRRSSGTNAIFRFIASTGEPAGRALPFNVTEPLSYLSTPNIARATSDLPEPTNPARATISPFLTLNETFLK